MFWLFTVPLLWFRLFSTFGEFVFDLIARSFRCWLSSIDLTGELWCEASGFFVLLSLSTMSAIACSSNNNYHLNKIVGTNKCAFWYEEITVSEPRTRIGESNTQREREREREKDRQQEPLYTNTQIHQCKWALRCEQSMWNTIARIHLYQPPTWLKCQNRTRKRGKKQHLRKQLHIRLWLWRSLTVHYFACATWHATATWLFTHVHSSWTFDELPWECCHFEFKHILPHFYSSEIKWFNFFFVQIMK